MIDDTTRIRLNRIAGMLASEHDGEVVNAARTLIRSLGSIGIRPEEMFQAAAAPAKKSFADLVDQAMRDGILRPAPPPGPHATEIDELLDFRWRMTLTPKSQRLLITLRRQASLSPDEWAWLNDMRAKLDRLRQGDVIAARANMAEDFV